MWVASALGARTRGGPHAAKMLIWIAAIEVGGVGQVPLRRRGPRAWSNYREEGPGEGIRLLEHSVADDTSSMWMPHVEAFLDWSAWEKLPLGTRNNIDLALGRRLDHLCYGMEKGIHAGQGLMSAVHMLWPDLKGKMVLAGRAPIAWSRMKKTGEGSPICEETIYVSVETMLRRGWLEDAIRVGAAYDGYLRLQDTRQLLEEDVVIAGGAVAATFGVSERGEEVKTGANQGIVWNRGAVGTMMATLKRQRRQGEKVFSNSDDLHRRRWGKTQVALGAPESVVHDIRHSGPSEDIFRNRRGLKEARRRGRWQGKRGVTRYSKVHWLVRVRSKTPERILRRGEAMSEDLYTWWANAVGEGPGAVTDLGKALVSALRSREIKDNQVEFSVLSRRSKAFGEMALRRKRDLQRSLELRGLHTGGDRSALIRRLAESMTEQEEAQEHGRLKKEEEDVARRGDSTPFTALSATRMTAAGEAADPVAKTNKKSVLR